jgi:hypothetical protein
MGTGTVARFGLVVGLILAASRSGFASSVSFVGYTGDTGDHPTLNGNPLSGTASQARTAFENAVGNSFYYEDFQNQFSTSRPNNDGDSLTKIGAPYQLSWDHAGGPTASPAPTSFVNASNTDNVIVRLGPTAAGTRGDYNVFDNTLASATGGLLDSSLNWYLDLRGDPDNLTDTSLTFTFAPGQRAVGLMLNDLIQPSNALVTVTFSDGTTNLVDTLGANKDNGNPGGKLANNGVWFLGVVGDQFISKVDITTLAGGDPITVDNIYVSTVPLPPAVFEGGVTFALLGAGLLARRKMQGR